MCFWRMPRSCRAGTSQFFRRLWGPSVLSPTPASCPASPTSCPRPRGPTPSASAWTPSSRISVMRSSRLASRTPREAICSHPPCIALHQCGTEKVYPRFWTCSQARSDRRNPTICIYFPALPFQSMTPEACIWPLTLAWSSSCICSIAPKSQKRGASTALGSAQKKWVTMKDLGLNPVQWDWQFWLDGTSLSFLKCSRSPLSSFCWFIFFLKALNFFLSSLI